ncbi:hypothetical protein AMECASPLE_034901 [Ameca splendens]|uniref:Uncharacterized protein n=1 Tax=Ameca splendens TaxID=208324 RepID=A0ABV0XK80_9TELE
MNKDSNLLDLTGWQPPVFFAPCIPFKNPVHPPPSTTPISEDPGPAYHSGTPLSTIICLTGKQLFGLSTSHPLTDLSINPVRLNNYSLVFEPEYSLLTILFILQLVSRFQFPCPHHCTVNKHFTIKLCLLNCFLHVGQIR